MGALSDFLPIREMCRLAWHVDERRRLLKRTRGTNRDVKPLLVS